MEELEVQKLGISNWLNNKINNMKKIKYIIGLLLVLAIFAGCEEEDYEFGDIIAPSNVQLTAELVGVDATHPNGDGSGTVIFTGRADNALGYKFTYNDSEYSATVNSQGEVSKSFNFISTTGAVGTFDLSVHAVSLIAYGTAGASTSTATEVEVLAPNSPPPVVIEDFEGDIPSLGTFGPDGHYIEAVGNPDQSGINTSGMVVKYIKPTDSQDWAGLFFSKDGLDLDLYNKTSIKVWSSKANIKMLFKLENVNNSISYEVEGDIVSAGAWQEITFDFSDAPEADYTKVVLFFDIWNIGDDSTYYFDDIMLLN